MTDHNIISDGVELTPEDEVHILIHSLRDANLPRFLAEDAPLFHSIMADLFPGISPPAQDLTLLEVFIAFVYFFTENDFRKQLSQPYETIASNICHYRQDCLILFCHCS